MKEADAPEPRCPECGARGRSTAAATIAAHVADARKESIAGDMRFCDDPACRVVYFDGFHPPVRVDELVRPVWPKDGDAPVCACFGVTERDVEACAAASDKARMRTWIERVNGPEARCALRAADGRSCEPALRRIFLRELGAG